MTAVHLPSDFASQSNHSIGLAITQSQEQAGVVAALVEAGAYPTAGILRFGGLVPDRHYLVRGAVQRFSRTSAGGTATVALVLTGPTLVLLSPLV